MTRAAYFLGGVLTGILGITAAACISNLVDEKRRYEGWWWESVCTPKADLAAEAATDTAEASDSGAADTDGLQTA